MDNTLRKGGEGHFLFRGNLRQIGPAVHIGGVLQVRSMTPLIYFPVLLGAPCRRHAPLIVFEADRQHPLYAAFRNVAG